jgi:Fe-S oxidoreductase
MSKDDFEQFFSGKSPKMIRRLVSGGNMAKKNVLLKIPSAYHDYWLGDLAQARSAAASLFLPPPGGGPAKYLFFPGCQLGASDPRYPQAAYELLLRVEPATALYLTCCGATAQYAGKIPLYWEIAGELRRKWQELGRPVLVVACLSCQKLINYVAAEIPTTTIYEVLAAAEDLSLPQYKGEDTLALADPCAARDNQAVRDAVNKLLAKMDVPTVILHEDMHTLPCCGFAGKTAATSPEVVRKIAEKRVSADPHPYLVYCANCRHVFTDAGKNTMHIIDLLAGLKPNAGPPHLSDRRKNRVKAKALLTHENISTNIEAPELVYSEEIANKMDRNLILEDDLRQVIIYAESSGNKFIDDAGVNVAHLAIGYTTYWAEYRKINAEKYEVLNCYYHRIFLTEPGREAPQ